MPTIAMAPTTPPTMGHVLELLRPEDDALDEDEDEDEGVGRFEAEVVGRFEAEVVGRFEADIVEVERPIGGPP